MTAICGESSERKFKFVDRPCEYLSKFLTIIANVASKNHYVHALAHLVRHVFQHAALFAVIRRRYFDSHSL